MTPVLQHSSYDAEFISSYVRHGLRIADYVPGGSGYADVFGCNSKLVAICKATLRAAYILTTYIP